MNRCRIIRVVIMLNRWTHTICYMNLFTRYCYRRSTDKITVSIFDAHVAAFGASHMGRMSTTIRSDTANATRKKRSRKWTACHTNGIYMYMFSTNESPTQRRYPQSIAKRNHLVASSDKAQFTTLSRTIRTYIYH